MFRCINDIFSYCTAPSHITTVEGKPQEIWNSLTHRTRTPLIHGCAENPKACCFKEAFSKSFVTIQEVGILGSKPK